MAKVMSKKNVNVFGESLAHFLGELGYSKAIQVCCDSEPVLAAGVRFTKDIRSRNGLKTVVTCGKAYEGISLHQESTLHHNQESGQMHHLRLVDFVDLVKQFMDMMLNSQSTHYNGGKDVGWERVVLTCFDHDLVTAV